MATAKEVYESAMRGEGALGRAADDEPVFVLRAQDELAPLAVEVWAKMAENNGCNAPKVAEAIAIAAKMRAWPTKKVPD